MSAELHLSWTTPIQGPVQVWQAFGPAGVRLPTFLAFDSVL